MSLRRDQLDRWRAQAADADMPDNLPVWRHRNVALLDALDEAEATITELRAALEGVMRSFYSPHTVPHVRQDAWDVAEAALARPEFPDTEKGDGR